LGGDLFTLVSNGRWLRKKVDLYLVERSVDSIVKRIIHIITGLEMGGAERALHVLLTGGLQQCYSNCVVSLTSEGHYGRLLAAEGIPVKCLGLKLGMHTTRNIWMLRSVFGKRTADLVQGWMYHGNLAATMLRPLIGGKVAWNIRCSLEAVTDMRATTRATVSIGGRLSPSADAIIYNSTRSRLQHESNGYFCQNGMVIPNGFDTVRWRPDSDARGRLRYKLGLPENARTIGYVSRSHPEKDPDNLFRAFEQLLPIFKDCHLICIGRGLSDSAPASLDRSRVSFLGEREDVPEIMPAFDLLCLSSRVEGFPNVVGEAMACGVPCVATDVGDTARVIAQTGWIVPPRNSAALVAALSEALALPCESLRALGQAARKRIVKSYSLDAVVKSYCNVYGALLGVD